MYDSDLTGAQWQLIEHFFAAQTFRKHRPRDHMDAIFYVNKTGCQWRMLPQGPPGSGGFPPWKTVYYHFRQWARSGLIVRLHDALRRAARVKAGRAPSPSTAIIDSQSVKTSYVGGERGFDGGKKVNGRKRHIVTDTLGFVLTIVVHSARLADSQQAPHVLRRLVGKVPRLKRIYADQGYQGTPAGLIWRCFGWLWHLVERKGERGFVVLEKRWIVERTFSWLGGSRRLSKDYEYLPAVSEAMVQLCSIRMMIRRLA